MRAPVALFLCVVVYCSCGRTGFETIAGVEDTEADGGTNDGAPPQYNLVFVTSTSQIVGDVGSITELDAICQNLANAQGMPGTFLAWASSNTVNARDRFAGARGWVRPDGKPVADTIGDLTSSPLLHPIRVTEQEQGTDLGMTNSQTATGTDAFGVVTANCNNWTDSSAGALVTYGLPHRARSVSFSSTLGSCSSPKRLFCFQADHNTPLLITPVSGRLAFVSASPWSPGGGLAAADSYCQSEATAAGLSGPFLALLATDTATAASRFDSGGLPWVRQDGIPLAPNATDVLMGDTDAPLNLSASGDTVQANFVWSGALLPNIAATGETCASWTSTNGGDNGGLGSANYTSTAFFFRLAPVVIIRVLISIVWSHRTQSFLVPRVLS